MLYIKTRDVKSPLRANQSDSGIDFFVPNDLKEVQVTPTMRSILKNEVREIETFKGVDYFYVKPNEGLLIPSGIKMILPEGYDLVFDNKSGVAMKKGLIVGAKVVDSSYRGEVHLHMINTSNYTQEIHLGEKIVQGIIRKVELNNLKEISEKEFENYSNTERGEGGFGSTGNF